MNRTLAGLVFVNLLVLSACSQALNERRARSLVQNQMDRLATLTDSSGLLVAVGRLTDLPRETLQERVSFPGARRVVADGYLEETASKITYLDDLTGTYQGPWPVDAGWIFKLEMTINKTTKPPTIDARYGVTCGQDRDCYAGTCQGELQPPNSSRFINCNTRINGAANLPSVALSPRPNNSDQLSGYFTLPNNSFTMPPPGTESQFIQVPMSLHGSSNHQMIEQEVYRYKWSNNLPSDTIVSDKVRLIHAAVDACEDLLLQGETTASCNCKWHSNLSKLLKSIFGKNRLEGTIRATFGKKPDGNWLVTNTTHDVEVYDISK